MNIERIGISLGLFDGANNTLILRGMRTSDVPIVDFACGVIVCELFPREANK